MPVTRRFVLAASATLLGARAASARAADPAPADPRMGIRAAGDPAAKLRIDEWFSLTCTHCARFAKTVYPEVKAKLVDTGKLYYVFRDYPLDQLALTAAMVARALPPERYEPFALDLLNSQMKWAFDKDVDSTEVLAQMAAFAGMPRELFDKTVADDGLKTAILAEQDAGTKQWNIQATPTFVYAGKTKSGEIEYKDFAAMLGLG